MKKVLTLALIASLASCGSNEDPAHGDQNQSIKQKPSGDSTGSGDGSSGTGSISNPGHAQPVDGSIDYSLLSPKFYQFDVKKMFSKKDTFTVLDKRYFSLETIKDKSQSSLNNQSFPNGLRTIVLKGKHLVLKKGNSQRLIEQLTKSYDLKELVIMAETLEVHDELLIPSTKVSIQAKSLVFKNQGSINTTPKDYSNRAKQFQNGKRGADAGNIDVKVSELIVDSSVTKPVFVLVGGNGQVAGLGQNGTPGRSMRDLGGGVVFRKKFQENCIRERPDIHLRDMDKSNKNNKMWWDCYWRDKGTDGSQSWPSNGQPAQSGGAPGEPGNGGVLSINIAIEQDLINVTGGKAGAVAGKFVGGAAGTPTTAHHKKYFDHHHSQNGGRDEDKTTESHSYVKGADVVSPSAKNQNGKLGRLSINDDKDGWFNEGYSEFNNLYANDLYIANRLDEAQKVFSNFEADYKGVEKTNKNINPVITIDYSKAIKQSYQIRGHLDYFGHSGTWVPSLSLEANYSAFETEVDRSMRILYLTYWLQNSHRKVEERVSAVDATQDEIYNRIQEDSKKHEAISEKMPILNAKVEEFKVQQEQFQNELKFVLARIDELARKNIIDRNKVSSLKKMVGIVAAISTVIPAGQPALAAAGTALNTIVKIAESDKPLQAIIDEAPDLYKLYKGSKIEESAKNWNKEWGKIKYSHYKTLKTKEEKKAYLKNLIKFSKPIAKEIAMQTDIWKKQQVPKNEFEAEVRKIKNAHPLFNELTNKLRQLVAKREVLTREILSLNKDLLSLVSNINEGFVTIRDLAENKSKLSKGLDLDLNHTMLEIEENTKERLLKYHYRMARAYEYRLLKKYKENLQLDAVVNKMKSLISANSGMELSDNQFANLKAIYEEKLSIIVNEVVDRIQNEGRTDVRSKEFKLTKSEISTLNSGHTIYLDIIGMNLFDSEIEDIRINDIIVSNLDVELDGNVERHAEAILEINYTGSSYIKKGDETFLFEFDDVKKASNLRWGATQNVLTGDTVQIRPSFVEQSLLRQLLKMDDEKVLLLSRPGALTQLAIKLKTKSDPGTKLKLEEASLKMNYDYRSK